MRFSIPTIVTILLFICCVPQAETFAQEGDVTTKAVNTMQKAGEGFVERIQLAFNNDQRAQQELMNDYLVPAAMVLILLIVGYLFASFMGRVVGTTVSTRIDKTIGRFAGRVVQNVILALVLLSALNRFGVDVTSFEAILAAAGFAVGMALQGTLSNFAAGVMLLVFRPFQIDDYISVSDCEGTVEEIDLFTTKLNTPDNRHVIVPNGGIFGQTMTNFTRNPVRRVDVSVGCSYTADIATTRTVLMNAINHIEGSVASPGPQVVLVDLGDSAVNWQCRVWATPQDYWAVRERTTEAVKNSLDHAGISIPFPQMDINVAGKLFAKAA